MEIADILGRLGEAGAKPQHQRRLLRQWVQALAEPGGPSRPEHSLPKSLRAAWEALLPQLRSLAVLRSQHPAEDGAVRLLLALADGLAVEGVLLPGDGLCVSTQVGCAVGCVFCMTGRDGLARQLGSAEIVAQVALARTLRRVRRVVFMGMGEPAHNLDAVMQAITLLGTEGAIGHKDLVFSTVGDRRVFERLPEGPVRPALALSLHTTKAGLRQQLLPRAPRIDPAELVELGDAYARATGCPLQVQWTLLAGVNDGDDEVDAIARLLHGRWAMLNLIPFNRADGLPWRRPGVERALAMARTLNRRGVLTRLRRSAGQDVDGGCGQLRARDLRAAAIVLRPAG
jgi:23S rRNA (adenine2503-C2)-methyltransferase